MIERETLTVTMYIEKTLNDFTKVIDTLNMVKFHKVSPSFIYIK